MMNQIGLIGIGVMGSNIALNLSDKNFAVKVFNNSEEKIQYLIDKDSSNNIEGYTSLSELIHNLEQPRTILLLVPSGAPTFEVSNQLLDLIDAGDTLIDAGNSYFEDSNKLSGLCSEHNISFIGMGVSGGEVGARTGPALMVGSENQISEEIKLIFDSIAANKKGVPCTGYYKGAGTGHFVKMIHNGIEYAEMQIIAEAYSVLKSSNFSNPKISDFFKSLSDINQSSYLIEITSNILNKEIDGTYLIDKIDSQANHKGTGKLTIETALKYGFPLPSIFSAFNARVESHYQNIFLQNYDKLDTKVDTNKLRNAIYFSRLSSMLQGLMFIEFLSNNNSYDIKTKNILNNWAAGCIIRSELLTELTNICDEKGMLDINKVQELLDVYFEDTKAIVRDAISSNIPLQVISTSLNWYLNLTSDFNPSNLIQAQRDYFGAHQVQLIGSKDFLHFEWD